jgi:hypothetical protein
VSRGIARLAPPEDCCYSDGTVGLAAAAAAAAAAQTELQQLSIARSPAPTRYKPYRMLSASVLRATNLLCQYLIRNEGTR